MSSYRGNSDRRGRGGNPGRKSNSTSKKQVTPTPAYLEISKSASNTLQLDLTSSSPRKLLVLGLGGTIIFRGGSQKKLTYERPYLSAFKQYLFAEETQDWLDTMIWGSAQPHNVDGMINTCFSGSGEKDRLVMVWTRDAIGLSKEDYNKKVETVKDMEKVWSGLPTTPSSSATSPHPRHSAMTTLLLDHSPSNGSLQPYNHLLVPEYDNSVRLSERDKILLAAIGILEAVKDQSNVAGWIRSGGLHVLNSTPALAETAPTPGTTTSSTQPEDDLSDTIAKLSSMGISSSNGGSDDHKLWFKSSDVMKYWVEQGKEALVKMGIEAT